MRYGYGYFEEDQLGKVADAGLWRRIVAYSWPHRLKLTGAVFLSFFVIGASLSLPYMVRIGVDDFIINTALETQQRISGLADLAVFFISVIIIGFAANFFQVIVLEWTGQTIMHRMRQQLFSHMLDLDLAFFHDNPSGKLVTRLTNDIQNMHEMFTSVIVTIFNDSIKIIGILVVLFLMNWKLALLLSLLLPIITLNTLWFSRLARDAFRSIRTNLARINSYLQESLAGISVIQIFLREKDTLKKFVDLNNVYLDKNLYQIKLFGIFMPIIELFSAGATACIIWYGGGEIIRQQMTLGELTAFLSYMKLFFQPIRELSQKYSIVQSAMASAERIFQLLDTKASIKSIMVKDKPASLQGAVSFEGVSFGYDSETMILHDLSFDVAPGKTLAIVGATGSGKSTIVNLIERFYEPDTGRVTIDGTDIRSFDINWLRGQVGLVMQDVFVTPATVKANILLDREMAPEDLQEILRKAQLESVIRQLPDGLETRIGEGGVGLSAGQKQLLAFARVLARDPRILILDEATSNVDSETEILIDRAIASTRANRTSIIIAHRLSTIRQADHILVMEQGRIAEQGSHDMLMQNGGIYQRLQDLQLNDRQEGEKV